MNSPESERAVLGAIILKPETFDEVAGFLTPDHFYTPGHQAVFGAMSALTLKGAPIDVVSILGEMKAAKTFKDGWASKVAELTNEVPSLAHALHHARNVYELAQKRALVGTLQDATELAKADKGIMVDEIAQFVGAAMDTATIKPEADDVRFKDLLKDSFDRIEMAYKRGGSSGLATGFDDLDEITLGLHPTDLVIIAGRPGSGKSSLAMNIVENVALAGYHVGVSSLEMSREQLVDRMLCGLAGVDSQRVRRGIFHDSDWPKLTRAAGQLAELPISIDDTPNVTIQQLRSNARRWNRKNQLALLVVDYLQLMRAGGKTQNKEQEIAAISQGLKALAKSMRIPVIALAQLNRGVESRSDKRPMVSDLRESGAIEQDADTVMLVFREEMYDKKPENEGLAEIIIGKQRHGPQGTVKMAFEAHLTRFRNLDRRW